MNKGEVVRTLSTRARIEPGFTTLGDVLTVAMFMSFVLVLSPKWASGGIFMTFLLFSHAIG